MDATDVDLEYGAAATPVDAAKPEHDYAQHFDADVVIPDRIARPAVASAHCFLALAVVSFVRGYEVLAAVAASTASAEPLARRVTSWRHAADLLAVAATAAYGSYLATARARSPAWTAAWWASLAAVAAAFAYNETRYYREVRDRASSSFTRPGTAARDAAYRRATWTHVACVHGGAAALAFVFVLRGLDDPS
ncbi:hypothetical protein JL722_5477 [Aureococcus anophagefferens]|nr:hypothetical protein JL722_5477 [Aureococcus anophagefferens]